MKLLSELRRREVWKTLALYIVGGWVVIQVADLLFPGWCIAESAIRHVWIAVLLGLPIALVVSWQFDISAAGLRRTTSSGSGSQALVRSDYALLMTLSVIMAGIVVMQGQAILATRDCGMDRPFDPPDNSIAVLPFVSLSANEEDAWLGTAFADTVLDSLANLPGTLVIERRSSFDPRLKGMSAREVAILLGVAFVLEGSVQRQGDRLRITPQIIDARENSHYWSSKIDRTYSDLFEIQDEVAEAAASAVQVVFSQEDKQRIDREGTNNLEALEEYTRAIRNLQVRTTDSVAQAAEQLQRAVELDPDFARAHALLGHAYRDWRYRTWSELADEELESRARDAAKTALRIAPGMSSALTLLGNLTDDTDAGGELYRQAVANGPNDPIALEAYSDYLFGEFQTDEAMEFAEKLIQLDPLHESSHFRLAWQQNETGRHRECLETVARGKEKVPGSVELRDMEYNCNRLLGAYSSMIRAKFETLAIDPKEFVNRWVIAMEYFNVGMPDEATRWWERATETAPEGDRTSMQFMLQATLDVYYQRNDEAAFESLRRWVTEPAISIHIAGFFPAHYIFMEYGDRLGRFDEVLSAFENQAPYLFTDPPDLEESAFWTNIVGQALLRAGDRQRGEPMLRYIVDLRKRHADSGKPTDRGIFQLLSLGDTDAALDAFMALPAGFRSLYGGLGQRFVLQNNPAWAPIREEPEFAALMEELDRNAAEQREKLRAMDLPVM